jgi:hypothetical protein
MNLRLNSASKISIPKMLEVKMSLYIMYIAKSQLIGLMPFEKVMKLKIAKKINRQAFDERKLHTTSNVKNSNQSLPRHIAIRHLDILIT